tara:strand:+ start:114 stop:287 length:174 start_codon:yes stop_codon:yes gene_type:complete
MKTEQKNIRENDSLEKNIETSVNDKQDQGKVNFFAKIVRLFRSKEEKKLDHQKYPLW